VKQSRVRCVFLEKEESEGSSNDNEAINETLESSSRASSISMKSGGVRNEKKVESKRAILSEGVDIFKYQLFAIGAYVLLTFILPSDMSIWSSESLRLFMAFVLGSMAMGLHAALQQGA